MPSKAKIARRPLKAKPKNAAPAKPKAKNAASTKPKAKTPASTKPKAKASTKPKASAKNTSDPRTFILHRYGDYAPIGKYVSRTPFGAAKKAVTQAASQGRDPNPIYLREVKSSKIREYHGEQVPLSIEEYEELRKKLTEDHGWNAARVPRHKTYVKYIRIIPYNP